MHAASIGFLRVEPAVSYPRSEGWAAGFRIDVSEDVAQACL